MISEDEAFWAGIAVATMMLGGGFSMLFLRTLTGEGAVVLALGLMTMALTIQMRAKPKRYIEAWSQFESGALTPTPPMEAPEELPTAPSIDSEQTQIDSYVEQEPSQSQEETAQSEEQPKADEQPVAEPPQPQQAEQVEEPSARPEAPKQEDAEHEPSEKLEEEPIVVF